MPSRKSFVVEMQEQGQMNGQAFNGSASGLGRPALIDVQQVAELLGCSARHVYRLADRGGMPRPVRLGALVRWNRSAVEEWIRTGCPRMS
jgi:excisionase family DNA binding protein